MVVVVVGRGNVWEQVWWSVTVVVDEWVDVVVVGVMVCDGDLHNII